MQGLSCIHPPALAGGTTALEAQSQVGKQVTDENPSSKRVHTSKRDLGTPIRVPLDSNGKRLCPTPKSTKITPQSNQAHNMRYQNVTSFQPLETIPSPTFAKIQVEISGDGKKSTLSGQVKHREQTMARRVLIDSNGQMTQETPRAFKPVTTPKAAQNPLGITCLKTMTPRALFDASEPMAPNSVKKPNQRVAVESTLGQQNDTDERQQCTFLRSPAIRMRVQEQQEILDPLAEGKKIDKKKRERDENEPRLTRAKAESDKLALFLRSPAVRVRVVDPKQKESCTSNSSLKQPLQKKARYAKTNENFTKDSVDTVTVDSSTNLGGLEPLEVVKRVWAVGSPAIRVRVHSPGQKRSLLRSPLVNPEVRGVDKKLTGVGGRKSNKRASTKRNLNGLLEAGK